MVAICQVCDEPFQDKEDLIMVGLTTYHAIESDVHYSVEHPRKCLELIHARCWGGRLNQDGTLAGIDE